VIAGIAHFKQRLTETLPGGSLRRRLVGGAFWSMVSSVIAQGIGAVAAIVTARILGKDIFGELGMIRSTIGLFDAVAALGLGLTANKFVSEYRKHDPATCGRILGLVSVVVLPSAVIAAAILAIAARPLAIHTLNAPQLANFIRIGALLLLLNAINQVQTGILGGLEAFRSLTKVSAVTSIIAAVLSIVGVIVGGLEGAVWALVATAAIACILYRLTIRAEYRRHGLCPDYRGGWRERRVLVSFALPNMLAGVMFMPAVWIVNALLVNASSVGYGELGVYNACAQWQNMLRFLPAQLLAAALPIMSSLQRDNTASFAKSIDVSHSAISMTVVPAAILMTGIAAPIMALYGKDFSHAQMVLILALTMAAVSDLGSSAGTAIQAMGKMWLGASINAIWAVLLIVIMFVWGRYHGAVGLAGSYVLAHLLLLIWGFWYIRRLLPPGMLFRTFCGLGLLLGCVAMLTPLSSRARMIACVPMAALVAGIFYKWLVSPIVREVVADFLAKLTLRTSLTHDANNL
jgi:O-antigen/teichoic acid export membrane protein